MADLVRRDRRPLTSYLGLPFRTLFEDIFDEVDRGWGAGEVGRQGAFVPAIDIAEDEAAVTVTAEVPGMSKGDLEVRVDNGVLVLTGEKKEEHTREGAGYHRIERRYGQFERRIRLPDYVDAEKIGAAYENGVLKLTMPKAEAAKARSIQIK